MLVFKIIATSILELFRGQRPKTMINMYRNGDIFLLTLVPTCRTEKRSLMISNWGYIED